MENLKVGNWLIHKGYKDTTVPVRIDEESEIEEYLSGKIGKYEKWYPVVGEYCWVKKEFVKTTRIEDESGYFYFETPKGEILYLDIGEIERLAEPFTGDLPSLFKKHM